MEESEIMDLKKKGGFAFPNLDDSHSGGQGGMTLRDHFAGQALSGGLLYGCDAERIAKAAYKFADAMIEERNK